MSIMAHKTLSAYKKPEIYLRTFKFCMHKLLKFDRRLVNLAFQFVTFIDYFQCVFSGGIFRTIWKAVYRFWAHGIWAPKIKAVKWKENLRTNMLSLLFKIRRKFRISFQSHQKSIKTCDSMLVKPILIKPNLNSLLNKNWNSVIHRKLCFNNSHSIFEHFQMDNVRCWVVSFRSKRLWERSWCV